MIRPRESLYPEQSTPVTAEDLPKATLIEFAEILSEYNRRSDPNFYYPTLLKLRRISNSYTQEIDLYFNNYFKTNYKPGNFLLKDFKSLPKIIYFKSPPVLDQSHPLDFLAICNP